MSLRKVWVNICPGCGRDVARPVADMPSGFRVICQPEDGGCGCGGCHDDTEAGAIKLWNAGLIASGVHHAA